MSPFTSQMLAYKSTKLEDMLINITFGVSWFTFHSAYGVK